MILNGHQYPMSEPPVKREGERAPEPRGAVVPEVSAAPRAAEPQVSRAAEPQCAAAGEQRLALVYRLLNYKDIGEVRAFVTHLFAISSSDFLPAVSSISAARSAAEVAREAHLRHAPGSDGRA